MTRKTQSETIPIAELERRALTCLADGAGTVFRPSVVAGFLWPHHKMRAQGAALAAGRILRRLQERKFVQWGARFSGEYDERGWYITGAGLAKIERN